MALIKWDDEEKKKEDEFFNPTPVKQVASVQSSGWQPAPSGANSAVATDDITKPKPAPGGIFDQQNTPQQDNYLLSPEKAQFDEQKRQHDIQVAEARRQQAAQAAAAEANARARAVTVSEPQPVQSPMPNKKPGQPKYTPAKEEGGFMGLIKGIGASIQQGFGGVADIAIKGGSLLGTIGKNDAQVAKQMRSADQIRNWLFNKKDVTGQNIVGTRDVEANVDRINAGKGSLQDYAAVGGKSLQVGIDATMFMNPARLAQAAATKTVLPAVERGASILARTAKNPAVRYAMRDAGFFGGLQGTATFQRVYGETGDVTQALEAAAQDTLIGGATQGSLDMAGHGLGTMANKAMNSLRPGDRIPTVEANGGLLEDGSQLPDAQTPDVPVTNKSQVDADGIASVERTAPVADGNVTFQKPGAVPEVTPVGTQAMPTVANGTMPQVATDIPTIDGAVTPTQVPTIDAPKVPEQVAPATDIPTVDAPPVADGNVLPSNAVPAVDPNMPVVAGEKVRQLQESRAGASQADEAVINQKLQEAQNATPRVSKNPAPVDNSPRSRAGITEADGYDAAVQKIDDARAEGKITDDEFDQLDEELFNAAEKSGDAIAETGKGNLPDDMTPVKGKDKPKLSPEQQARKDLADRYQRSTTGLGDTKANLARAVGLAQDTGTDVRTLLKDAGVDTTRSERIATLFDKAEEIGKLNAKTQKKFRKEFTKGDIAGIDEAPSRERNRNTAEEQALKAQLSSEIKKLAVKGDVKERLTQALENTVSGRAANMLTGASVIEKNVVADIWATLGYAAKNPIQMARSVTQHGNIAKNTLKAQTSGWKDTPKTVSEAFKYVTGNTFHTAMAGAQAAANLRSGAVRTQMSRWVYKELIGKELSLADAEKLSRTAGNDFEALVNMATGVENGTINDLSYRRALKNAKAFIKSGSDADYAKYLDSIDKQSSLASSIMKGVESEKFGRVISATVNALLPFMRNAVNMTTKAFTRDLNPMARSLVDEIRVDQMGAGMKIWSLLKNKAVDYGALAALSTVLVYNDGSEVDKPQGVSIDLGNGNYFSVRGTPIELPLGIVLMTKMVVQDSTSGKSETPGYYFGVIKSSIPYISQMEQNSGIVNSITDMVNGDGEGDGGYAAKAAAVNAARSVTPLANNSIEPWMARNSGNSLNAKTTYASKDVPDGEGGTKKVADMPAWYMNQLQSSGLLMPFGKNRSDLKDSRDAAGRMRTVDNQGALINKTINDKNTKTHNDTIDTLVNYGRQNGLGKGTKDMFNTYPDGKDNNFKSIQDSITFLDTVDGKIDNAKKLEQNSKLTDLSKQIRDGFYGGTGDELLTLNGQPLKSDASVPNTSGSKNSKLPMSMQSIKNAIAATDLSKEQSNMLYVTLKDQNDALWDSFHNKKAMSYEQYSAAKAEISNKEVEILSSSKNYQKLGSLMGELDRNGFFLPGGLGSTKSGQTYLWNALNTLLGAKGATPAANYPKSDSAFTPWGKNGWGSGGGGSRATNKPGDRGNEGIKWTPVTKRQQAAVAAGKYTPVNIKVKLGSQIKKDRSQNYADRSF